MKLKVVVLDLELPLRAKRIAAVAGIPLVLLGGGAVAFANAPHTFKDGDVLKAEALNQNFADIDRRASSLEKVAKSNEESAVRARVTGGQTIPGQNIAPIAFADVLTDKGSEFDGAKGLFTSKVGGWYLITCGAQVATSTKSTVSLTLRFQATPQSTPTVLNESAVETATSLTHLDTSTVAELPAGGSVHCAVSVATPAAVSLNGDQPWDKDRGTFTVVRLR